MLRVSIFIYLFLLVGCVVIPAPQPEPYDSETLAVLIPNKSTKIEVVNKLGETRVMRRGGDIWIYGAARRIAFGATYGGPGGAIEDHQFLVLHFSGNLLVRVELVEDWRGCSEAQICVSGGWVMSDQQGSEVLSPLASITSAGTDDLSAKQYELPENECLFYVYNVSFGDPWWGAKHPDAGDNWSYFQLMLGEIQTPQISGQAYFMQRLQIGTHDLVIHLPPYPEATGTPRYGRMRYEKFEETSTSVTVLCEESKLIFLAARVSARKHKGKWTRDIDAEFFSIEEGKAAISKKKLLLLK